MATFPPAGVVADNAGKAPEPSIPPKDDPAKHRPEPVSSPALNALRSGDPNVAASEDSA